MARVFITGIAGFIGFHLALFLKERGDFVVGCDNFNSYYDPALKQKRAELLKQAGIEVIRVDINESAVIEKAIVDLTITHIAHLAAQAGVRHSLKEPQVYVQSNLAGFVSILEICRRHPEIKLVYASSSSVYGRNQKVPFSETDQTDHPASFYGATKQSNERIASAYHHLYGISVTGLRYFTVYGPWGRPDMAYFSFTEAVLSGKPIQVYNQGIMQRDFTYIDDIVRGTAAALDLGANNEIFNLGNNRPEELMELIRLIEEETGQPAQKEFLPMQPGDVTITYADISKSQKMLGFQPSTPLKEGISKFVKWYRKHCEEYT